MSSFCRAVIPIVFLFSCFTVSEQSLAISANDVADYDETFSDVDEDQLIDKSVIAGSLLASSRPARSPQSLFDDGFGDGTQAGGVSAFCEAYSRGLEDAFVVAADASDRPHRAEHHRKCASDRPLRGARSCSSGGDRAIPTIASVGIQGRPNVSCCAFWLMARHGWIPVSLSFACER
jgi:hypothetical protein